MKVLPVIVDVATLAKLILSNDCKSIGILTGAGVSVASGIPDFRSPGGMYDTLQPQLITSSIQEKQLMSIDPTYVVSWDIFKYNSFPFLEVQRPFLLGMRKQKWKATIAHRFFELLHMKTNKVTRIYTQNIDGLDYQCTNIPTNKIINIHGTISEASCDGCDHRMEYTKFCNLVESNIKDIYDPNDNNKKESIPINCENCGKALVKPRTVLFGQSLPTEFFECIEEDLPTLDLLLIAGTSLVVSPANSIVQLVPSNTIRVVINQDPVGQELGIRYNNSNDISSYITNDISTNIDFFLQGDCDEIFLDLIKELGWLDDLILNIDRLPPKSIELISKEKITTIYQ